VITASISGREEIIFKMPSCVTVASASPNTSAAIFTSGY
jgi:hypothetical protein